MTNRSGESSFVGKYRLIVLLTCCITGVAAAGQAHPLKPIDTSSPRATLRGFLEFMNEGFRTGYGFFQTYLASSNLYLTPEQVGTMRGALHFQDAAQRALDISELPPTMVHESAHRLAIQLKEILDRIELPPIESIPDAEAMAKTEFKRWALPDSEIRIRRVETGARAGEYLFTPETLRRLPEFYAKVKDLPYRPGASVGWYNFSTYSPAGVAMALHRIVPPRWLVDTPQPREPATLLDQPLWRWIGIALVLSAGFAVVLACFRLSRRWADRSPAAGQWAGSLRPVSLVMVTPVVAFILAEVLRISGMTYQVVTISLWSLFFLALTWMVWCTGGAVAESVISSEKLKASSIDSQLIRLVLRLLTTIAAVAILVVGADRIGLPAYSVVAGLGVGGLAVALAAQQTLANLLGSLIIMFEKPFAIGHMIKVKDIEGTVEKVGFRSTRIRTTYDSVVTLPSSQLVNSTIDNFEERDHREVRTVLTLTYDTPPDQMQRFVEDVRHLIAIDPVTRKDNIQVAFYEFGAHSLDILVKFFVKASSRPVELAERQRIFLAILRLAEAGNVRFAFPTETVHIESLPGGASRSS